MAELPLGASVLEILQTSGFRHNAEAQSLSYDSIYSKRLQVNTAAVGTGRVYGQGFGA